MAVDTHSTRRPFGTLLPSRRALLGVLVSGTAYRSRPVEASRPQRSAEPPGPDEILVEDCEIFDTLETRLSDDRRIIPGLNVSRDDALRRDQQAVLDRIIAHRALTIRGIRRRADTLVSWADDLLDPGPQWDRQLIAATLRDLRDIDLVGEPVSVRGAVA